MPGVVSPPPITRSSRPYRQSHWRAASLVAAATIVTALWFAPIHDTAVAQKAVAIAGGLIVLWATEAIPLAGAGVLGLVLFWCAGVSPLPVILSGFTNESVWFLLGALLIGTIASRTGLANRLAFALAARAGSSYGRLLAAFIVADFLLTFFVPSGLARVTVLAAIAAGLVEALGIDTRSNVARGLMLIITYTAGIFDKLVLAGAASILASGIIRRVGGVSVGYGEWFVAYLPADLLTIAACWWAVLRMYPASTSLTGSAEYVQLQQRRLGPWSAHEKRAAALLALAVALWMTDAWHHLRPAVVALGVVAVAFLPGVRLLRIPDLRDVRFGTVVFTGAALSMTAVLADSHGLDILTRSVVSWLEPFLRGPAMTAMALYWTAFVYHFFLGAETSMLSATLPSVLHLAERHGLAVVPVGLIWTYASAGKLFAYQGAVLMVGYAYGYFDRRDLLRVGFVLSVVQALILLVIVPVYWPLIGLSLR